MMNICVRNVITKERTSLMKLKKSNKEFWYIDEKGNLSSNITECYNIHQAAIKNYCQGFVGCRYLELGVSVGHSAINAWLSFQPREMVLCDLFDTKGSIPIVESALNIIDCKAIVTFVVGYTQTTLKYVKGMFDVILVDGDHTCSGAMYDLHTSWGLLNPGGILIFDDIEIRRLRGVVDMFIESKNDICFVKHHTEWKHGCSVVRKTKLETQLRKVK